MEEDSFDSVRYFLAVVKVISTSFGSKFNPAIQRLGKQIENLELGCLFGVITERNIDEDNRLARYKNFISENRAKKYTSKGFLWYTWKPWVLLRTIIDLKENEVFVYLDAGTEVPREGKNNFKILIELARNNGTFFFRNPQIIRDYTRPEVLGFFSSDTIDFDINQIAAGVLFIRNDFQTRELLREWCRLSMFNNGYLFDDEGYVNHRHDQSVLSIIIQKYKFHVTDYPIWFPRIDYLSRELFFYPIHTLRNSNKFSQLDILYLMAKIPNRFWIIIKYNERVLNLIYGFLLLMYRSKSAALFWNENWERILDVYAEVGSTRLYHRTRGDLRDLLEIELYNYRLKVLNRHIVITQFGVYKDLDTGVSYSNQYRQFGKIEEALFIKRPGIVVNDNKSYLPLLSLNDNNLFHFLYDLLYKAIYLKSTDEEFICIVKDDLTWKIELLNFFGLNYIILNTKIIEIERALLVNSPIYSGDPSIEVCNILNESLSKHIINISVSKNLLILRRRSKTRRVLNHEYFQILIEKYNFIAVELEDFSISEQITMFQNAEVIVAAHGAGLSWLFGCRLGTIVIELFSENYLNFLYGRISDKLNLKYYSFICQSDHERSRSDPDIIVTNRTVNEIEIILKKNQIK